MELKDFEHVIKIYHSTDLTLQNCIKFHTDWFLQNKRVESTST